MKLNVAISCDDNYARHAITCLVSLYENNKEFKSINVYLIDNGVSNENKEILEKISYTYQRNLKFIEFDNICSKLSVSNSFPVSSYARLFLSSIQEIDKILYIDCDAIVNKSLAELWSIDLNDFYVAGVRDAVDTRFRKNIGLNIENTYVNAGFLLINLKKWREDYLQDKFIDFIKEHKGNVPHHDQGTINGVCKNKILVLNPKYNLMGNMIIMKAKQLKKLYKIDEYYSQEELNIAIKQPVFIHFTADFYNRPWNKNCTHPHKELYIKYLNMTKWKDKFYDKPLSRNTRIMKYMYDKLPFEIYCFINRGKNFIKR